MHEIREAMSRDPANAELAQKLHLIEMAAGFERDEMRAGAARDGEPPDQHDVGVGRRGEGGGGGGGGRKKKKKSKKKKR
eukprot:COSAG01_NODE_6028_length_3891_cov_2.424842_1_plen_79_part_00